MKIRFFYFCYQQIAVDFHVSPVWWAVNPAVVSSGLAAETFLSAFYLHNRQLIKLFIMMRDRI